jgi:hypothetical protein
MFSVCMQVPCHRAMSREIDCCKSFSTKDLTKGRECARGFGKRAKKKPARGLAVDIGLEVWHAPPLCY